ncbi:MAG: hypothetical protein OXF88_24860 [Rhodobacteraceae bacterium]|nr:hypothetical protein [Paracoccaceae bacterium]MCY4141354.1 hypothetical protein [Paracoccaceae bacterium]
MRWLLLVLLFAIPASDSSSADQFRLKIDPATFTRIPPQSTNTSAQQSAGAPGQIGPKIDLQQPDDNAVFSANQQIAVHLIFLPADDGTMPDMSSLDVLVRKGWFGKNITDIVVPYIDGNDVLIPEVDFSGYTGKFDFKISISDHRGRTSTASFRITVLT